MPLMSWMRPAPADRRASEALSTLYLTLYLRGQAARAQTQSQGASSIGARLAVLLFLYAVFGMLALALVRRPVFMLAVSMHATTFILCALTAAGGAGALLFDRNEGDILLHRPIEPGLLLRAKVVTLLKTSLWCGFAYNLLAFGVGVFAPDGGLLFPVAHALSIALSAVFSVSVVVLMYQLCLRWVGRERLEGVITGLQVATTVLLVVGGQIVPRMMNRIEGLNVETRVDSAWTFLLPPAWFAGLDEAIAGSHTPASWVLALLAIGVTTGAAWLAFGVLARGWEEGAQKLAESATLRAPDLERFWLARLADGPLRWWFRDDARRVGFVLVGAYMLRNRELKLRLYPAVATSAVFPIMMLLTGQPGREGGGFILGLVSAYLSVNVLQAMWLVQQSEHWSATDHFRAAPLSGPGGLMAGARRAVLLLVFLPSTAVILLLLAAAVESKSNLLIMLPGILLAPIASLLGSTQGVPLGRPPERDGASRLALLFGAMTAAGALSAITFVARRLEVLPTALALEAVAAGALYLVLRRRERRAAWPPME